VFIVQFVENKIENPKHKFLSSASEPASAKTVGMRASGGTNCGLPSVVVVLTNFQFLYRTAEGIRDQPNSTNRLLSCRAESRISRCRRSHETNDLVSSFFFAILERCGLYRCEEPTED